MKAKKMNDTISFYLKGIVFPILFLIFFSVQGSDKLPDNVPEKTTPKKGIASYYNNSFQGKKTANGEIFSQQKLTCASNVYPLGTWLRITNVKNGNTVIVKVNDRMHPRMKRVVDLSRAAAEELKMIKSGLAQVEVENLGKARPVAAL
jgi:rare lipoprotein A